jgi:uncharacterized membrane protein
MDAYLEEELYDILTYCIQNPNGSDFEMKRKRAEEIGSELYADGGLDESNYVRQSNSKFGK